MQDGLAEPGKDASLTTAQCLTTTSVRSGHWRLERPGHAVGCAASVHRPGWSDSRPPRSLHSWPTPRRAAARLIDRALSLPNVLAHRHGSVRHRQRPRRRRLRHQTGAGHNHPSRRGYPRWAGWLVSCPPPFGLALLGYFARPVSGRDRGLRLAPSMTGGP